MVHEHQNAVRWLDENQLAELTHWIYLFDQESVGILEDRRSRHTKRRQNLRDDSSLVFPRFGNESCIKGAIIVRGGELKFTSIVGGVHAGRVSFSSPVLIIVVSLPEWLKAQETITDKNWVRSENIKHFCYCFGVGWRITLPDGRLPEINLEFHHKTALSKE